MKKISSFLLLFMFGFLLNAQTAGELIVSVATSSTGGNYAPRNIVAIWVEDDAGNFVKTLLAQADKRITHLNTWQAATSAAGSEYNKVDAITGATNSSHITRTCTWDGTDFLGNDVLDGGYYVWMELTDKNSTGNFSSFAFTKGTNAESLSPSDVPSFASIAIKWEPETGTDVLENKNALLVNVYPNPGSGIFTVSASNLQNLEVYSLTGELIHKTSNHVVDLSSYSNGVYIFKIQSNESVVAKRIVKR